MSRFSSNKPMSPGTSVTGGLRNTAADRRRQALREHAKNQKKKVIKSRGNKRGANFGNNKQLPTPPEKKIGNQPLKPPQNKGGSPNQLFKNEQKKIRENRIKNREINRPGTDPVKVPKNITRPGYGSQKKNKITSLTGNFINTVLKYGIPLGPTFCATTELYKKFLEKKKNKF